MINDSADIPGISKKFTGEYPKVLAGTNDIGVRNNINKQNILLKFMLYK